ncbi:hypothetical protein [Hymenobacter tenuis]
MQQIKVGFCVAYDWYYLEQSVPLIYDHADVICLALDRDRISWSGNPFTFDEKKFNDMLVRIDPLNKIDLYEDDFHITTLTAMENDTRQRNLIAQRMGKGGWHVQIDSDEYFLDFARFSSWLRMQHHDRPVNIRCQYINLFKQLSNSFLVTGNNNYFKLDGNPIATNNPIYEYARVNSWFNIYAPFYILHQSWARPHKEITEKVYNWSHKDDFNKENYLDFWAGLDENNYKSAKNFHPIWPHKWEFLNNIPANSIDQLISYYDRNPPYIPSAIRLFLQNNIWFSRLKSIFGV